MNMHIVLKPRVSEKSYMLSQVRRTYVIDVPANANKHMVATAVAEQFKVTVEAINILNVKGKVKNTPRKNARPTLGTRADTKKAYVRLKEGDTLPFFAEEEKAAQKASKKEVKEAKEKK